MTGDYAYHAPAPQPLIARWYNALGFSTVGTEYDPATGTYQPQTSPVPDLTAADPASCGADPGDCARWIAGLGNLDADITLEAS